MRRTTRAISGATTPGRRSAISISRTSPAGARRQSCSPGTMRGGWRSTSPNCRSYCGGRPHPSKVPEASRCDAAIWSLLGDKRTSCGHRKSVAHDPIRKWSVHRSNGYNVDASRAHEHTFTKADGLSVCLIEWFSTPSTSRSVIRGAGSHLHLVTVLQEGRKSKRWLSGLELSWANVTKRIQRVDDGALPEHKKWCSLFRKLLTGRADRPLILDFLFRRQRSCHRQAQTQMGAFLSRQYYITRRSEERLQCLDR